MATSPRTTVTAVVEDMVDRYDGGDMEAWVRNLNNLDRLYIRLEERPVIDLILAFRC